MTLISKEYLVTVATKEYADKRSDAVINKKKVSQRIIAHIPHPETLTETQICQVVQHALTHESKERFDTLTIERSDKTLIYKIGNRSIFLIDHMSKIETDLISLRPIRELAAKALPNARNFSFHFSALIRKWPIYIPAINLLWALVIAPILALIRVKNDVKTQIHEDNASDLKRWEESRKAENFQGTISALEECVELISRKGNSASPKEAELLQHTKKSLQIAKDVALALKQPDQQSLKKMAQNTAKEILEALDQKSDSPMIMSIPCGYYIDGTYYPVILSFFRNAEGLLCLEKLSSDPGAQENCQGERIYYTFPNKKQLADKKQLSDFLETAWLLQKDRKPPSTVLKSTIESLKIVETLKRIEKNPFQKSPITKTLARAAKLVTQLDSEASLFDSLIAHAGGVLRSKSEKEGESKRSSEPSTAAPKARQQKFPKQDFWDMWKDWIADYFPEVPEADKMILTMDVLSFHMDTVLRRIDELSPQEKQTYFPLIQGEMARFRRLVDRSLGNEKSFKTLAEKDEFFAKIHSKMLTIERAIEGQHKASSAEQTILQRKDFEKSASTDIDAPIIRTASTEMPQLAPSIDPTVMYAQRDEFQKLEDALAVISSKTADATQKNKAAVKAKASFDKLATEVNKLANGKDWYQTQAFASKILGMLPIPKIAPDPLSKVTPSSIWDINFEDPLDTREHLDGWGKTITLVTKCMWEAKLRVSERYLWPQQRVDILKGRAILEKILRRKVDIVDKLVKVRLKAIESDKKLFDECTNLLLWTVQSPDKFFEDKVSAYVKLKIPYEVALDSVYESNFDSGPTLKSICCEMRYLPSVDPQIDRDLQALRDFLDAGSTYQNQMSLAAEMSQKLSNSDGGKGIEYLKNLDKIRMAYGGLDIRPNGARTDNDVYVLVLAKHYLTQMNRERTSADSRSLIEKLVAGKVADKFEEGHNDEAEKKKAKEKKTREEEAKKLGEAAYAKFQAEEEKQAEAEKKEAETIAAERAKEEKEEKAKIENQNGGPPPPLPFLPNSIIDLRRHSIFSDILFQSTIPLTKMVPPTILGGGLATVVSTGTDIVQTVLNSDNAAKEILEKVNAETMQILRSMTGRLDLRTAYNFLGIERIALGGMLLMTNIYSDTAQGELGRNGLMYDRKFMDKMHSSLGRNFKKMDNYDTYQEPVTGYIPPQNVHTTINSAFTEPSALRAAMADKTQSVAESYLLRSLFVAQEDAFNGHETTSPREALELVCQRTDLLEDEKTQRGIEIAIFKTADLQELLDLNPEFFIERASIIRNRIEHALAVGNDKTAAFLMHIGDRLQAFARETIAHLPKKEMETKESLSLGEGGKATEREVKEKEAKGSLSLSDPEYLAKLVLEELDRKLIASAESAKKRQEESEKNRRAAQVEFEKNLEIIKDIMPGYNTKYSMKGSGKSGRQILMELALERKKPQKYLMTFFIDWFYHTYNNYTEDKLHTIPTDEIVTMLYGYSILRNIRLTSALPLLQTPALDWINYTLLPRLVNSLPPEKLQEVLTLFYLKCNDKGVVATPWKLKKPLSFISDSIEMELSTGKIKTKKEFLGPVTVIPNEISKLPKFMEFFGSEKIEAHTSAGDHPSIAVYQFKYHGKKFRVLFNSDTGDLFFDRWIKRAMSGASRGGWFRYYDIDNSKGTNAAEAIARFGVWKNLNGREAMIFLTNPAKELAKDVFRANVSRSWKVSKMYQDDPRTGKRFTVCHDPKSVYTKWLPCLPSDQILLLRSSDSSQPSEIRILGQNLVLSKSTDGTWIVTHGKCKGFKWVPTWTETSTSNQTAQRFAHALGDLMPECILSFTSGKEVRFLIQAHQLDIEAPIDALGHQKLTFKKIKQPSFIEFQIMEDGQIQSTTAGYLYLAYLFHAKGDTKRAYFYMQKASLSRIESSADRHHFDQIVEYMREQPAKTIHKIAFRLKAEIAFTTIMRQQTHETTFDLANSYAICKLYRQYQEYFTSPNSRYPKVLLHEELTLTPIEHNELEFIRKAALENFVKDLIPPKKINAPKRLHSEDPRNPQKHPLAAIFPILSTIFMEDPNKEPPDLLSLSESSHLNLLQHFWQYLKRIDDERLTPHQLRHLLVIPTQELDEASKLGAPLVNSAVQVARDYLLALSASNMKKKLQHRSITQTIPPWLNPLTMDKLYSAKKSLPKNLTPPSGGTCQVLCQVGLVGLQTFRTVHIFKECFDMFSQLESVIPAGIDQSQAINLSLVFGTPKKFIFNPIATMHAKKYYLSLKNAKQRFKIPMTNERKAKKIFDSFIKGLGAKLALAQKEGLISPLDLLQFEKAKFDKTALIEPALKTFEEQDAKYLLSAISEQGFDFTASSRLTAISERIDAREKRLREQGDRFSEEAMEKRFASANLSDVVVNNTFEKLFQPAKVNGSANTLDSTVKEFTEVLTRHPASELERHENEELIKGFHLSAETLKKRMSQAKTIADASIPELSAHIKSRQKTLKVELEAQRKTILEWAASKNAPMQLNNMSAHRDLYGDAEILERVFDLYEEGELRRLKGEANIEEEAICTLVTRYLLAATEIQQYQKAEKALLKLEECRAAFVKTGDLLLRNQLTQEYRHLANDIFTLLKSGSDRLRYSKDKDNNVISPPTFQLPHITRSCLVFEYRKEIILREKQLKTVLEVYKDPNILIQMRMGDGKTTIMSLILKTITRKNMLAIGLVTRELYEMNQESFDATSRHAFKQSANKFHFSINIPDNPIDLANLYERLLTAKEENNYIVLTVDHLAAIENKLTMIAKKIAQSVNPLVEKFEADQMGDLLGNPKELVERALELIKLKQQKMWLSRISDLLYGNKEKYGFPTQYFGDEIDELFRANDENNVGETETMRGANRDVRDAAQRIMTTIFNKEKWPKAVKTVHESRRTGLSMGLEPVSEAADASSSAGDSILTESELKTLDTLRTALLMGQTASLIPKDVRSAIEAVAKLLHRDLIEGEMKLSSVDRTEWVKYVTELIEPATVTAGDKEAKEKAEKMVAPRPSTLPTAGKYKNLVSQIKEILSSTLKTVLSNDLGIDAGLGESDCVSNPLSLKRILHNTLFGKEQELVLNQYLLYAATGPTDGFFENCLRKMPFTHPALYRRIIEAVNSSELSTIIKYLKSPDQHELRLIILNLFVFDAARVTIAAEQITLPVHRIIQGRDCGGTSGTINLANLPPQFIGKFNEECTRKVEAEHYLQIALGKEDVQIIDDSTAIPSLQRALSNDNLRAIINQGVARESNTIEIIQQLRACPAGLNRQFVFIHPIHKKSYMWLEGEDAKAPIPYDIDRINSKKVIFYYDAADSRGVDQSFHAGLVMQIPGPTSTHTTATQGAARARKLGPTHRLAFNIPLTTAKRISAQENIPVEEITLAHVINDIKLQTLIQQPMLNFKTQVMHVQSIAFTGLRRGALFADDPASHNPVFWEVFQRTQGPSLFDNFNLVALGIQAADALADAHLFGIKEIRDRMILPKEINFNDDFEPSELVDTHARIVKMYEAEERELHKIREMIRLKSMDTDPAERGRKLVTGILSWFGVKTTTEAEEKEKPDLFQYVNGSHYNNRLRNAMSCIDTIIRDLNKAKAEFIASKETMEKYLPKKVEVSNNGSASTNVTMTVHVKVQVDVKVKEVVGAGEEEDYRYSYDKPEFSSIFDKGTLYNIDPISRILPDCGLDSSPLCLTNEIKKLIKIVPILDLLPLAKIAVFRKKMEDGTFRFKVCLIGKNDLNLGFHSRQTEMMKKLEIDYQIFSLDIAPRFDPPTKPVGLDSIEGYATYNTFPTFSPPEDWDQNLILQIALARLVMGCRIFTEREQEALRDVALSPTQFEKLKQHLGNKCTEATISALDDIRRTLT